MDSCNCGSSAGGGGGAAGGSGGMVFIRYGSADPTDLMSRIDVRPGKGGGGGLPGAGQYAGVQGKPGEDGAAGFVDIGPIGS
jgi:hypothetical protein